MKAQHVSSGTPLIIRSSKLYLQPLVYTSMWWPAVVNAEWDNCPTQLLMMSDMPLETCWAFNKRWNNKFYYKVASGWLFLLINTYTFICCFPMLYTSWSNSLVHSVSVTTSDEEYVGNSTLRYNPEGSRVRLSMVSLKIFTVIILSAALWPWGRFRRPERKATTLPLSCADCLDILEPQPPGTLRACQGLYRDCFNP